MTEKTSFLIPESVTITDVCPRDGLQNIREWISTVDKLAIIDGLIDSGIRNIEVTSFVHPSHIPQMKDAMDVAKYSVQQACANGISVMALVPNIKGAERAWDCGIRRINYVISASPQHNVKNINRMPQESLIELATLRQRLPDMDITLIIATAFGCPFQGRVSFEDVAALISAGRDMDITRFTLCDTIGVANPLQVHELLSYQQQIFPDMTPALHFHNTHGMALANILTALQLGITHFESSIGGLGGCPFAPGAAGNVATEDVVNMFDRMGIRHGINQNKLRKVVSQLQRITPSAVTGLLGQVRSYDEFNFSQVSLTV